MTTLALFDLDGTLLDGDSDYGWAQFLIRKGVLDRTAHEARNLEFFNAYKAGTLDIFAFLEFQLKVLTQHSRQALDAWHAEYMRDVITPMMTKKARALVNKHLAAGDLCAVVTATNRFVTAPITAAFDIPHLVATDIEEIDGRFTGKPRGTPCFREGKLIGVDEWLDTLGCRWNQFDVTWFYSDSLNDIPLLERVTNPVAVDPDPQLRVHAEAHNWPVISLKDHAPAGMDAVAEATPR